ncbi:MAG: alpha/beta hydrolase [Chloroflexi bacterium]|nr:MAG: alpha/beta hydrolase [Chloroflexota bacterium]
MRVGPRQPDHEREPSGEQTDAEREVAGHARGSWHRACQHVPVRRDIAVNGVRLHCVLEGKGPLVLLLHGFPESAYAWRKQIPALAERFRVVAPDLRGYAESDKPPRVSDYRIPVLVADIVGLIQALGEDRAHVVGHDWGGAIAWAAAETRPEAVDRLVVLNCPHPMPLKRALRSLSRQVLRSWYVLFFQLPRVPEAILGWDGGAGLERMLRGSANRGRAFSDDDLLEYRRAFSMPGAATATLNYYRAVFRDALTGRALDASTIIQAPTLLIWAEDDVALGRELTNDMQGLFASEFRIEYVPHTSHWVMEERPELVNRLLLDFLRA